MAGFFDKLFASEFMPHGHCYYWKPEILWLHVLSDGGIALSYFSIPVVLVILVKKRADLAFNWMFVLFASFIFCCGATHVMGIWTVWNGTYRLEGVLKAVTATVSLLTAVMLWPLLPRALRIPSTELLEKEIANRTQAEESLRQAQVSLEEEVALRTNELNKTVTELECFNRLAIGREQEMIKLKKKINELSQMLGQDAPYDLFFASTEPRD